MIRGFRKDMIRKRIKTEEKMGVKRREGGERRALGRGGGINWKMKN